MESKFTGGLLGLIGIGILSVLLTVITLSFGIPWVVCIRENWYTKHTIINGKQLKFVGKGGQLLGQYIKWLLLTFITLGIYGFWLTIKMKQWVVSKTEFA